MTTHLLETRQLVKRFGQVNAVLGVDLRIEPGQHVAVMGPSASGKSTLLNCMAAIMQPTSGDVLYDGRIVSAMSDRERTELRRTHFGFVFQDGQLIPELPARENVALPLMLCGIKRPEALQQADGWLTRLGLWEARNRLPGQMSGGQMQKTAVARALIHGPSVIFADEPTGALDQGSGHELMQLLTMTARQAGATLVLVTHDFGVARWCERLVEIRDGMLHTDQLLAQNTGPEAGGGVEHQQGCGQEIVDALDTCQLEALAQRALDQETSAQTGSDVGEDEPCNR